MKRIISLTLVLVLCLSLCACGAPKTFADAVAKAEGKIEKWDAKSYNTYRYASAYPETGESFTVVMVPTLIDTTPAMYTSIMAKTSAEEIYEETAKCFSALDTIIMIAVMTEDGEILYMFDSGTFE